MNLQIRPKITDVVEKREISSILYGVQSFFVILKNSFVGPQIGHREPSVTKHRIVGEPEEVAVGRRRDAAVTNLRLRQQLLDRRRIMLQFGEMRGQVGRVRAADDEAEKPPHYGDESSRECDRQQLPTLGALLRRRRMGLIPLFRGEI